MFEGEFTFDDFLEQMKQLKEDGVALSPRYEPGAKE